MFLEIKTILNDTTKTGKFWSKWVDDVWEENCVHAVNLNSVKDLYDMNDYTCINWDENNKSNTWRVYYFDDKPLECECGIFISSKVYLNKNAQGRRTLVIQYFPRTHQKATGSNHSGSAIHEFSFRLLVRILSSAFALRAFMYSA